MDLKQTTTGIVAIGNIVNRYFSQINPDEAATSLVELSQVVRVEPNCLVDANLRTSECITDTLQTVLSLFSSFYVQAVTISLNNMQVRVNEKLEPFGTRAPKIKNLLSTAMDKAIEIANDAATVKNTAIAVKQGFESFSTYRELNKALANKDYNPFTKENKIYKQTSQEAAPVDSSALQANLKEVKDDSKLSIGKMVVITISKDDNTGKGLNVPIAIRLMTGYVKGPDLVQLLSFGSKDISAIDREIGYKTGRLSFWKDIVGCRDLYDQFRRNLMKDKTGYFKANLDNQSAAMKGHIITGQKYTSAISATTVLSAPSAKALEENLGIRLSNYQQRNKLMQTTGMMIMAVVDESYRMVEIYLHSVERPMQLSFNDLKRASGKDSNVNDIMSALIMGNAPRL